MLLTVYLMINFINSRNMSLVEVIILSAVADVLLGVGRALGSHLIDFIK